MSRMPIPPLIVRYPECPLCGEEVDWDEGFVCVSCEVSWPERHGEYGSTEDFEDPDDPSEQCPEERLPWADSAHDRLRGYRYRCVKRDGHDVGAKPDPEHFGVRVDRGDPDPENTYSWYAPRASRVPSG